MSVNHLNVFLNFSYAFSNSATFSTQIEVYSIRIISYTGLCKDGDTHAPMDSNSWKFVFNNLKNDSFNFNFSLICGV